MNERVEQYNSVHIFDRVVVTLAIIYLAMCKHLDAVYT